MKRILVPTDFSPAAENATAYAAQLARQIEASLVLLHVYQLPPYMHQKFAKERVQSFFCFM